MHAIVFRAHQKLDRVSRRHLRRYIPKDTFFPSGVRITYFEGKRGPDSAKLKRQVQGEQPWHFIDPFNPDDTELHELIDVHYEGLVKALKDKDEVQAAFQAAWLAHALVDGLTPAHHYPYEEELERLRGGESRHTRNGLTGRLYVKSPSLRESVLMSTKLVGPKGLLTNHAMFEVGSYALIRPLSLNSGRPGKTDLDNVLKVGVVEVFKQLSREIADLRLYDRFIVGGWTPRLARQVRNEMAPRMVKMITLAWYCAYMEAKDKPKAKAGAKQ
ncbi:MAG TPA: hypothetical protein VFX84_03750 [Candidatus Saccharimonadales bacterium]|nr:hypothetical protein [Candidatus Saccharimonadales bacterium]